MTIEFRCSCGAVCRAEESEVGQLHHCEACGLDIPVPSRHAAERVVEDDSSETGAPAPSSAGGEAADIEGDAPETGARASAPAAGEGEPHEGEPPTPDAGMDDLRRQVVSQQDRAQTDEEAEAHRASTEALREQLGGGGLEDIAAGLHDTEDDSAQADAAALAEKRRGDADALREQLGGGGVADIAAALRGEEEETGPTAEADRPSAAPPIDAAALRQSAAAQRKPQQRVLRGHERAAHHITFKRAIWVPALLIGLLCMAVGVLASVFHIHPVWAVKDLLTGEPSAYEAHMRRFEEELTEAGIPLDGFKVVEYGGSVWAMPQGATLSPDSPSREAYYLNESGFEVPAVNAENYAECQTIRQQGRSGLLMLGVGLVAVGLALVVLSIITYRDVRIVRATQAGEAEEEAGEEAEKGAEEMPAEPVDAPEDTEGVAPATEGEDTEAAAGPSTEQDEPRPLAGSDEADRVGDAPETGADESAESGEEPPPPPDHGLDEEQGGRGASD